MQFVWATLGILLFMVPALGQTTNESFDKATELRARFRGKTTNLNLVPHWLSDGRFWYERGKETILVDPKSSTTSVVADPKTLPGTGATLPPVHPSDLRAGGGNGETKITFVNRTSTLVKVFWLEDETQKREYTTLAPGKEWSQNTYIGHAWLVTDERAAPLVGFVAAEGGGVAQIDGKTVRPRPRALDASFSPDGKWHVVCEKFNVVLKPVAGDEPAQILTTDGTKDNFYSPPIRWSPNSQFFTTDKTVPGQHREIPIISSSPKDQTQPKLRRIRYDKPGDRLDISRPALFDAKNKKEIPISDRETLLNNPFGSEDPQWTPDSSKFYVSYNQRGHQLYQILEVSTSGSARVLLEEKSATFIDWTNKIYFQPLNKSSEALWMSERDGWNHLYLFDLKTGKLKKQLTKGNWVVRGVERVDEERREVILRVGGVYPEQDPYFVHYAKVGLDTGKLTRLTEGDGTHSAKFSPDGTTFVDTYSRVDLPPVHELRSALTGKKLLALESADTSELLKLGWKAPERFVSKGRDGKTNIYGLIFRPLNFDSTKKYPVIENIYAGPHGQHVPKLFSEVYGSQELAELGFIVVQIDGMGTNWRSKVFHDVCWKNLADGGFPDRILWMRAAAEKYPELDLSRVGIFGTSAGGQNALHALLLHGDFYKVGVADCGCYDNRMDKVWWNEQWMGWPIGPHYAEQSCVTLAPNLTGKLFLLVGEEDTNVDPSSTMQVVDALIRADKDFDLLVAPGVGHGVLGTPHARRRMWQFFLKNL